MWQFCGKGRPSFAEAPDPEGESVWDYPRPPRISSDRRRVIVEANGRLLADTDWSLRVLETASPPTFYLPSTGVNLELLRCTRDQSICEWKGVARYWALRDATGEEAIAWDYPRPSRGFASLTGHIAFYPGRVECYVDGERVRPQPGHFYGGWVTLELTGPFKGEPGSEHW